jgi:hypothetical protein
MKTFAITFIHISGEERTAFIEAFDEERARGRFQVNFGWDMPIIRLTANILNPHSRSHQESD